MSHPPFDYEVELSGSAVNSNSARCTISGRLRIFSENDVSLVPGPVGEALVISWTARMGDLTDIARFSSLKVEPLHWVSFFIDIPTDTHEEQLCFFRLIIPNNVELIFPIHRVMIDVRGRVSPTVFRSVSDIFVEDEDKEKTSDLPITNELILGSKEQSITVRPHLLRCLIDVSDLCQYWGHSIRPTGIQRVQLELLQVALQLDHDLVGLAGIDVLHYSTATGAWRKLGRAKLLEMILLSQTPDVDEDAWRLKLENVLAEDYAYDPGELDVLVNVGSSWWIPDYHYKIKELKKQYGFRYVPFIHDVIPLITPEYCAPELVDAFRLWFHDAVSVADFALVNSRCSLQDVTAEANSSGLPAIRYAPILLNARPTLIKSQSGSGIVEALNLDEVPYILTVGTLESRKNHALLFDVWARLHHNPPRNGVWKLVCVGKYGYMYDIAKSRLEKFPFLSDYVVILSEVSDADLADLYRNARFTMFPSFYEGWGLPVTEAQAFGKLTVASSAASIPEAASEGDILLDPTDIVAWSNTTRQLIDDPEFLASATRRSLTTAIQRSWTDVGIDLLLRISELSQTERMPDSGIATIMPGWIYTFSSAVAERLVRKSALTFRTGLGWHAAEMWGNWTGSGRCELTFTFDSAGDDMLMLKLIGGPVNTSVGFIADSSRRETIEVGAVEMVNVRIPLSAPNGDHSLRIVVDEICDLNVVTGGEDKRRIGVGCIAMMVCRVDDLNSRLNFIESMCSDFIEREEELFVAPPAAAGPSNVSPRVPVPALATNLLEDRINAAEPIGPRWLASKMTSSIKA